MRAMGNSTVKHNHSLERDECDCVCRRGSHTHSYWQYVRVEMLPCRGRRTSRGLWSFKHMTDVHGKQLVSNGPCWPLFLLCRPIISFTRLQHPQTPLQPTSSKWDDLLWPHQSWLTHDDLIKAGRPAELRDWRLALTKSGPSIISECDTAFTVYLTFQFPLK